MKQGWLLFLLVSILLLASCSAGMEKNLVLYYKFDETQGEEAYESVSKALTRVHHVFNRENQPLLYQEARDPDWRKEGIVGGALLFDGYSTYLQNDLFKMPNESFTISLWVAPRAFEWGDESKLSAFVSQSNFAEYRGMTFGMYRLGEWGIRIALGGKYTKSIISVMAPKEYYIKPKVWNHVAVTFDQKSITLYYNGKIAVKEDLGDYVDSPMQPADSEPFLIGKHSQAAKVEVFNVNMFNGLMDELKIYDVALSEKQISEHFKKDLKAYKGEIPNIKDETIDLRHSMYASDRNRPQFHAIPPGHWMNEPHAPFYYNGYYHLFYQHNPTGPFWHQIHWGHWVSKDMINWEDAGIAIRPHEPVTPDGVWSGSATLDQNGNPVLFITAGNDSKQPNQSVAICRPKDLSDPKLKEWVCEDKPAIEQQPHMGKFGEFRDPFVFTVDNVWYILVGSGTSNNQGGTALLFKTTDFEDFTYIGPFYISDYKKYNFLGLHWELPVFLPLRDQHGNATDKWLFAISPHPVDRSDVEVYYWIGTFDRKNERFVPDHEEPRLFDYGDGVFTGPSGFVDPKTGRSILFTIAQGVGSNSWQDYYSGWAHTAGMPISIWYNTETESINFEPIEEIKNAREKRLLTLENTDVQTANNYLKNIRGDMLEIILEIEPLDSSDFGINVRESLTEVTTIRYDMKRQGLIYNSIRSSEKIMGYQREIPKPLKDGKLQLKILLDRSLVEIYMNQEASITSRIYPTRRESQGISLFANNGQIKIVRLEIYQMKSVFLDDTVPGFYPE